MICMALNHRLSRTWTLEHLDPEAATAAESLMKVCWPLAKSAVRACNSSNLTRDELHHWRIVLRSVISEQTKDQRKKPSLLWRLKYCELFIPFHRSCKQLTERTVDAIAWRTLKPRRGEDLDHLVSYRWTAHPIHMRLVDGLGGATLIKEKGSFLSMLQEGLWVRQPLPSSDGSLI
jgi:hypothetical protein